MNKKLDKATTDAIKLVTPSGFEVIIRQQTGEDDDVISNPNGAYLGEALNKFVQGIIIKLGANGTAPSYNDIENMKLGDKYFIMIASRMFSLGPVLKFEYEWDDGEVAEYEEELENYIWDYELDGFPEKGSELYSPYRIPPHKHGDSTQMEFSITSGKKFRFTFMNGLGEKYLMTLPEDQLSKNTELKARNLEQKLGEEWVKVENFKAYTAREMSNIRKEVFDNDPITEVLTEIPHPTKKGKKIMYSLLTSPDFLFPREI